MRNRARRMAMLAMSVTLCLRSAGAFAPDDATLRLRQATPAELKAVELGTGGALVVVAAPAELGGALRAGDMIAFADMNATLTPKDLADAVRAAGGKPLDIVYYRDGTPDVAAMLLTLAMLGPMEAEPPAGRPVDGAAGPRSSTDSVRDEPGSVVAAAWSIQPVDPLSSIENGRLKLHAGEKTRGTVADRQANVTGDFDLRIAYSIDAWDRDKLLDGGFGVRIESTSGWAGGRIVTFDRNANRRFDKVIANAGDGDDKRLAADVAGNQGELRITRTGDRFTFAYREALGADGNGVWTELGVVPYRLSPTVSVRLVTFKVGTGLLNVTVTRADVITP